jgi:predicted ATP-dependent endonuclease of OLD family
MSRVFLKSLRIQNFGPIKDDTILLSDLTFLVGRNNAGKSHYLKAVELLLTSGTKKDQVSKWQNDKTIPIKIEGHFTGIENFTNLVENSNHKNSIERSIMDGELTVVCTLKPDGIVQGIYDENGDVHNPTGFIGNLLKVLPDVISISAIADTVQELLDKSNTALTKIKKEVMDSFFQNLSVKTKEALAPLDEYLNSSDPAIRSPEIIEFEKNLKNEFMGEFENIVPSIEFGFPDETVISKEMRILLDDGHKSEVELKGNGLQRATLLALLKLLARNGKKYHDHPPPIFLIGEVESFLHPYAQKQIASALSKMKETYQIITTTHSPFVINSETIEGYRRVTKAEQNGSKNFGGDLSNRDIDLDLLKRHLEQRGNLEGLFADRVILIEGRHDSGAFERLRTIFNIEYPKSRFTLFVKANGSKNLRNSLKFYRLMGFDDVSAVSDLDYLFSNDIKYLLDSFKLDRTVTDRLRKSIGWTANGDPSLDYIMSHYADVTGQDEFEKTLESLRKSRFFILKHGAPESYYKNNKNDKDGWKRLKNENDLLEPDYLRGLMTELLK